MKIETIRKPVDVVFEDGSRLQGSLFLSPASAHRWGVESIEELLNGDRRYLPMELGSKEVVLLSKSAIVMAVSTEKETEAIHTNAKKIPVELFL